MASTPAGKPKTFPPSFPAWFISVGLRCRPCAFCGFDGMPGGRPLLGPQAGSPPVAERHIAWHTRQVFRGEARSTGRPSSPAAITLVP
ncbi:hypothetical protein GCM10009544_32760 [Streptomyces stramineus]|uniref:Uncharacterized protein n=1 Tax=Streptomyces stramineus TaxID=173861 RepID=A0ABP3K352_9ACTN